ncbi:MAG: DUF3500 domain-containing protein [Verrucomicrobiota bacterium]
MRTILTLFSVLTLLGVGQAHEVGEAMATAATDFLNSLDKEQKDKATFELTDEERENWHYIPIERKGLAIRDMRADQRQLAHGLLSTGLSHTGYLKAVQIMSLERLLWELENENARRDPEYYLIWIFGKPDPKGTWGWRFEGHHLSLNFTIVDGKLISETPAFWASNPGMVKEGPRKGLRVLADEEDVARELVKSLTDEQKKKAVIADVAPKDILTKDHPKVEALEDKGIPYGELDDAQKKQLWAVIDVYLGNHHPVLAEEERDKVQKEIDSVKFAWAGGFEFGEGHYYYVQGKTFILEYCNIQNEALHPHAAWRNFDGDFARDLLREHYEKAHANN